MLNRRKFLLRLSALAGGVAARVEAAPAQLPPAPVFDEIHKIDIHSHIFEDVPSLASMLKARNLRIINVCNRGADPGILEEQDAVAQKLFRRYGGSVFPFASSFDLSRRYEADYSSRVIGWLERNFRAGAVMVKIWKEVGMQIKTADGKFVLPDDPVFDPVYDYISGQKRPLLAHIADPIAAWQPLSPENPYYGYYSRNPEWHLYGKSEYPSHGALMDARDRIMMKHPGLVLIGAHFGSLSHDVDEVARRLDRYPHFYVECSARTAALTRQPTEKVRSFFLKYSSRILYGQDMTRRPSENSSEEEQQRFTGNLERRYRIDFQYYSGSGQVDYGGRKVQALALPREVLDAFYHGNAFRIIPSLRQWM